MVIGAVAIISQISIELPSSNSEAPARIVVTVYKMTEPEGGSQARNTNPHRTFFEGLVTFTAKNL